MRDGFEEELVLVVRAYHQGPPEYPPGSMAAGSAAEHRERDEWAKRLGLQALRAQTIEGATPEGRALLGLIVDDLASRGRYEDVEIAPNVRLIGPFRDGSFRLAVDGFEVPYARVRPGTRTLGDFRGEPDPSGWDVILDDRLQFHVPKHKAAQTFALLANAMALGAGWSCFGTNRARIDPFGVRVASMPGGKGRPVGN